jgi:hypothetical protein
LANGRDFLDWAASRDIVNGFAARLLLSELLTGVLLTVCDFRLAGQAKTRLVPALRASLSWVLIGRHVAGSPLALALTKPVTWV